MLCHELPDLLVLALTQPELGCSDCLFYLAGMTCADNRCSDRTMATTPAVTLCALPISASRFASSRLRERRGSWNSVPLLRQSSSGRFAIRALVILPVSRPEAIGE